MRVVVARVLEVPVVIDRGRTRRSAMQHERELDEPPRQHRPVPPELLALGGQGDVRERPHQGRDRQLPFEARQWLAEAVVDADAEAKVGHSRGPLTSGQSKQWKADCHDPPDVQDQQRSSYDQSCRQLPGRSLLYRHGQARVPSKPVSRQDEHRPTRNQATNKERARYTKNAPPVQRLVCCEDCTKPKRQKEEIRSNETCKLQLDTVVLRDYRLASHAKHQKDKKRPDESLNH